MKLSKLFMHISGLICTSYTGQLLIYCSYPWYWISGFDIPESKNKNRQILHFTFAVSSCKVKAIKYITAHQQNKEVFVTAANDQNLRKRVNKNLIKTWISPKKSQNFCALCQSNCPPPFKLFLTYFPQLYFPFISCAFPCPIRSSLRLPPLADSSYTPRLSLNNVLICRLRSICVSRKLHYLLRDDIFRQVYNCIFSFFPQHGQTFCSTKWNIFTLFTQSRITETELSVSSVS